MTAEDSQTASPLQDRYQFYERYHQNYYNRLVHVITVPIICVTLLMMTSHLSPYLSPVILGAYSIYYLYLDRTKGLEWIRTFGMPCRALYEYLNAYVTFKQAATLHLLCWIVQVFVGHGLFEGNRPAFLTGLVDSVLISPLFVMMEASQMYQEYQNQLNNKSNADQSNQDQSNQDQSNQDQSNADQLNQDQSNQDQLNQKQSNQDQHQQSENNDS